MLFILIGLLGACNDESKNNSLIVGFSFGFSLMIFLASLGQIRYSIFFYVMIFLLKLIDSGGHFNPAVTLGIFLAGSIQLKKALLYILMQLIGGAMAAGIFRVSNDVSENSPSVVFFNSFYRIQLHIIIVVVERRFW
jgi:aquaporin Z